MSQQQKELGVARWLEGLIARGEVPASRAAQSEFGALRKSSDFEEAALSKLKSSFRSVVSQYVRELGEVGNRAEIVKLLVGREDDLADSAARAMARYDPRSALELTGYERSDDALRICLRNALLRVLSPDRASGDDSQARDPYVKTAVRFQAGRIAQALFEHFQRG